MKFLEYLTISILLCLNLSFCSNINKRSAVGPLWPNKKIPYTFSNIIEFNLNERELIKNALKQLETSLAINGETCLEFIERHNEPDYILFTDNGECSSGIGYFPGKNRISLADDCIKTGTVIHEVMHRLGFDHEHSRQDRDNNIHVLINNTSNKENFEMTLNNYEIDVPYDFHSVIHYNSDALQNANKPTLISKVPILLSDSNEIYHKREGMTPLDIYKIQRLYKCKALEIPDFITGISQDDERVEREKKRFKTEANFNSISNEMIEKYLNQTFSLCGGNYFWPLNYPLVESNHRLYKLICMKKKSPGEKCRFSIECNSESVCIRPFFKKVGYCIKIDNEKINNLSQNVNDSMFEYGKKVLNVLGNLKKKIFG
ncbi:unnamed protein product [Brachionus calyciflorus]|uniref:Metalloendopeptidase n=1 Tax=Brachionus calyciflorus TaxID=104777 RepID=A0A813VW16_9BILA|nr:unnamed protein product [Brachionus calyciflorus]